VFQNREEISERRIWEIKVSTSFKTQLRHHFILYNYQMTFGDDNLASNTYIFLEFNQHMWELNIPEADFDIRKLVCEELIMRSL
jgi:hypothetical protein